MEDKEDIPRSAFVNVILQCVHDRVEEERNRILDEKVSIRTVLKFLRLRDIHRKDFESFLKKEWRCYE